MLRFQPGNGASLVGCLLSSSLFIQGSSRKIPQKNTPAGGFQPVNTVVEKCVYLSRWQKQRLLCLSVCVCLCVCVCVCILERLLLNRHETDGVCGWVGCSVGCICHKWISLFLPASYRGSREKGKRKEIPRDKSRRAWWGGDKKRPDVPCEHYRISYQLLREQFCV